jgi:monoamine oxidase
VTGAAVGRGGTSTWAAYYGKETELDYDVAILGAGVAGLAAGRTLAAAGLRIAIIEARSRVGGRIFTMHPTTAGSAGPPVELGAEFIHGLPAESWELLREALLDTYELDGATLCSVDGILQRHDEQREGGISILEQMTQWLAAQPPGRDMSFADYLPLTDASPAARARAVEYVEGFNAADSTVIGIAALARQQQAEDQIDSDRLFRVLRGYDALPKFLSQQLVAAGGTVLLDSVAQRIDWQRGAVTVSGMRDGNEAFSLSAKRALISVPLGILQAGTIEFAPAPGNILTHARRLKMGPVLRITLIFRKRFWAKLYVPEAPSEVQAGLERLSFLFTHGASPPTWWTPMPHTEAMITAWVAGPRALLMEQMRKAAGNADALVEMCLTTLANAFDLPLLRLQKQLLSWHTHDWQADPYALGAYSYAPAGAVDASAMMTEPVEGTLYFAGEHTDISGHWGTVHGALRSGLRAAAQLRDGIS